ncbi:hypothetical protein D3C71_748240 [compost metagenome]
MLDQLQAFDHRFRFHRRQPGQSFTATGHYRDQCQILGHIDQMPFGCNPIALAPLDRPLERFVQQLTCHDRQHDLAQHRYEHRHHVQPQHADFQQVIELFCPHPGVDVSRGHRMTAYIGDHLGAVLVVEVSPQISVGGPDTGHAFASDPERIEVGIVDRLTFTRPFGWQLFDVRCR